MNGDLYGLLSRVEASLDGLGGSSFLRAVEVDADDDAAAEVEIERHRLLEDADRSILVIVKKYRHREDDRVVGEGLQNAAAAPPEPAGAPETINDGSSSPPEPIEAEKAPELPASPAVVDAACSSAWRWLEELRRQDAAEGSAPSLEKPTGLINMEPITIEGLMKRRRKDGH